MAAAAVLVMESTSQKKISSQVPRISGIGDRLSVISAEAGKSF